VRSALAELSLDVFSPFLDRSVGVSDPVNGEAIGTLRLAEVTSLPKHHPANREPFSLIFEGPATAPLGQGTYRFAIAAMSELDIFIVPIGERDGLRSYQAIFS